MLTRVYVKWVPLLTISGGTGKWFHLLQGLSLPLSNRQDKLQVLANGSLVNQSRFLKLLLAGI